VGQVSLDLSYAGGALK